MLTAISRKINNADDVEKRQMVVYNGFGLVRPD